jgi:hypothetical protein
MSINQKYIDTFTAAYVAAANTLFDDATRDSGASDEVIEKSQNAAWSEAALELAKEECGCFIEIHKDVLDNLSERGAMFAPNAGNDLWLTRNGHGAGFWDRGLGADGETLSKTARAMGAVDVVLADDGMLMFEGTNKLKVEQVIDGAGDAATGVKKVRPK